MRSFATDTLEKPPPIPVAFQAKFGPPCGHCFSNPLSVECPSRFSPRHCGQSPAVAPAAPSTKAQITTNALIIMLVNFKQSVRPVQLRWHGKSPDRRPFDLLA